MDHRWRALANTVEAAIVWTARPDGWVTGATGWEAATGLPESSMLGRGWLDALHPEDRHRAEAAWAAATADGAAIPFDLDLRFRDAAGRWHRRHVRGTPVRDPETGAVREWVGLAQFVEDRRRTEAAWRALVEATPGLVFATDAAGSNIFTNRRYQDYAGLTAEALLGEGWLITLHPEDRTRAAAIWAESVRTGESYEAEYRFLRADGEARWHLVCAAPQRDPATGRVTGWVGTCTDVDDRRAGAAAARLAAERLELALDAGAIIGTWVWLLPTDHFTADERFARFFGLDPERCRAGLGIEAVLTSVHPGDLPRLRAAIAEAFARGGPYRCEYRVRQQDGVYRWIEANGRVELAEDGTPLRFPGVLLDIEARRTAEAGRDRAAALLSIFTEAVPGVVYAKDREGRMLVANRGTTELIGKPPEFYLGRTDAEFLDNPAQAEAIMATDRRIMEQEFGEQVEEEVRLPDGSPAVWLSNKAPLRDERGTVVGLIGSSLDITARKRAEEALAASEERFRFALDAAGGIGTWDWDVVANRVFTDPGFAITYGLDPAQASTGLTVEDYVSGIHPEDRVRVEAAIAQAVATGGDYRMEYRIIGHGGVERWVLARGRCFLDTGGGPVRFPGVTMDITERKRAEAALTEALEVKEVLLAEVNHRVKNSLQLVSSLLSLQAARTSNPELRTGLAEARGRIGVVAQVHRRLYQAGTHGRIDDLAGFLRDLCVDAVAALDREDKIQFLAELPSAPISALIDRAVPLALIVSELVTNAVKYAYPGDEKGVVRFALSPASEGGLLVTVEDDGIGLPDDFNLNRSGSVGMRVITTLARQLRGRLEAGCASPEGGAAFKILLPSTSVVEPVAEANGTTNAET